MLVSVAMESPLQEEVRALVAMLNATLEPLSPIEHQYKMSVKEMARPDTSVFVAREKAGGKAVGIGALKTHRGKIGEVKRMFTLPECRGRGVGQALLLAIDERARELGMVELVIETGKKPGYKGAHRLYQLAGFARCGPVLDYRDTGSSDFFIKKLVAQQSERTKT